MHGEYGGVLFVASPAPYFWPHILQFPHYSASVMITSHYQRIGGASWAGPKIQTPITGPSCPGIDLEMWLAGPTLKNSPLYFQ
jgi:hypothetical protein